jgi:hypothetical protein
MHDAISAEKITALEDLESEDKNGTIVKVDNARQRGPVNLRDIYTVIRAARLIDYPPTSLRLSDSLTKELKRNSPQSFRDANASIVLDFWRLLETIWGEPIPRLALHQDEAYFGIKWWEQDSDGRWFPLPSGAYDKAPFGAPR